MKNNQIDPKKIVRNIMNSMKLAEQCDLQAGNFYHAANELINKLAEQYGKTPETVAGVMAALSPGTSWELNQIDCKNLLSGKRTGFSTYPAHVEKAIKILKMTSIEDIYTVLMGKVGCKTANFYLNMLCNLSVVTIDRHAFRIAMNDKGSGAIKLTVKQYRIIEDCYRMAAKKLNMEPAVLQAVTWNIFKRTNDRGKFVDTPF